MEGLYGRPPAFGTCSCPALDRPEQREFIVVRLIEVHGFADASSRAYAAIVYLRVILSESNFQVSLICAKTKVAPVKTISIPRLELNAVVLLSHLLVWTQQALSLSSVPTYG
jgi:hypothetical protein